MLHLQQKISYMKNQNWYLNIFRLISKKNYNIRSQRKKKCNGYKFSEMPAVLSVCQKYYRTNNIQFSPKLNITLESHFFYKFQLNEKVRTSLEMVQTWGSVIIQGKISMLVYATRHIIFKIDNITAVTNVNLNDQKMKN